MSFIVSLACLPLYLRADELSEEETEIQKKLSKRVQSIKKNSKGDERLFLLQTYYKQNNYHPIMALRLSLSLLLQIPIFIAAYYFFSHLHLINGLSLGFITNLAEPDNLLKIGNFNINMLPILMTVINLHAGYIYTKDKSFGANKVLIVMSLIFLVLLYNSPAILVLYWTYNNLFSLLKNICLRITSRQKFLKIAGIFAFFVYYTFVKAFDQSTDFIIYTLLLVIMLSSNKVKNFKLDFEYKNLFLLSILSLWIIIGIFIPSKIIASSPTEFIFYNRTGLYILSCVATIFFGLFVFWGYCIFYFSNKKLKKIFTIATCLTLFLSILNIYIVKLPSAILSNILVFEVTDNNFTTLKIPHIFYFLISVFIIFAIIKLIILSKTKFINIILSAILITSLSISVHNFITIKKTTDVAMSANKKYYNIDDKYINLSKTHKNVIIIFLDRALSSYFPIILKEHPYLKEQYQGFTYYPNTLSYAGYTALGYLPITGGYEYTPFQLDKRDGVFEEKYYQAMTVLPAIFSRNNYTSTVINPIDDPYNGAAWEDSSVSQNDESIYYNYYDSHNINHVELPSDMVKRMQANVNIINEKLAIRNMFYFDILNILPPSYRYKFYDNGNYHNVNSIENMYSERFIKNYAELFFINNITEFSSNNDTFIIFNSLLPHFGEFLNYPSYELFKENDDSYIPPKEINDNNWSLKMYHVNVAALKFVGKYLDLLRKNNAFDNSRIIIVADHGYINLKNTNLSNFSIENYAPYNPLLLVKDFNSNSPLQQSYDFMTNADVPILATKNIIQNPINPYTNKNINFIEKSKGIVIKHDHIWWPSHYVGQQKVLHEKDTFNYVNGNPLDSNNWKTNLSYKQALEIYNNTSGK